MAILVGATATKPAQVYNVAQYYTSTGAKVTSVVSSPTSTAAATEVIAVAKSGQQAQIVYSTNPAVAVTASLEAYPNGASTNSLAGSSSSTSTVAPTAAAGTSVSTILGIPTWEFAIIVLGVVLVAAFVVMKK